MSVTSVAAVKVASTQIMNILIVSRSGVCVFFVSVSVLGPPTFVSLF